MSIQFNHTVVHSRNQQESAEFLADILGLEPPQRYSHFDTVQLSNGVTLDFMNAGSELVVQHYAFLVGEPDFDEILGRIRANSLEFWADPYRSKPNEINTQDGGRGVYFDDPSGHILEIITRPYGSGS